MIRKRLTPDLKWSAEPYFVPFTPAGSMLAHIEGKTEEEAWKLLLAEVDPAFYPDRAALQRRGFTVEKIDV